jgi:hypothetical protein
MPSLAFRSQPFSADDSAAEFVRRVLSDRDVARLTLVVAWVRFGGLGRLQAELEAFVARGGALRVVLGIDAGGATRPGLALVRRLATEAYAFHDPAGGTFHPKLYLAEGEHRASLLVGSSNATAGGLFRNYEAALEATFELPEDKKATALAGARRYIKRLLAETELCLPLTESLIDRLVGDPRYAIQLHERQRSLNATTRAERRRSGTGGPGTTTAFGRRSSRVASIPPLSEEARRTLAQLEGAVDSEDTVGGSHPSAGRATGGSGQSSTSRGVVRRWYKTLNKTDAQQLPKPTSRPSASLTLVAGGHDIDITTYFREVFFGEEHWTTDGRQETADINCEVVVRGTSLGRIKMTVVHNPALGSKQGNRTTMLRWGQLQPFLRANDLAGDIVSLEALGGGDFRVVFDSAATGPFVA